VVYIVGGAGNDSFAGGALDDLLSGGDNDDHDGNDTLAGGGGNDTLHGGGGHNSLSGGEGADTITTLEDYPGNDYVECRLRRRRCHSGVQGPAHTGWRRRHRQLTLIWTSAGKGLQFSIAENLLGFDSQPNGAQIRNFEVVTIYGSGTARDVIAGGELQDSLYGSGGNDSLSGQGGADYLDGYIGADRLNEGDGMALWTAGLATIACSAERRRLDKWRQRQRHRTRWRWPRIRFRAALATILLNGGAGDDTLYGGPDGGYDEAHGNNLLRGGTGNDLLTAGLASTRCLAVPATIRSGATFTTRVRTRSTAGPGNDSLFLSFEDTTTGIVFSIPAKSARHCGARQWHSHPQHRVDFYLRLRGLPTHWSVACGTITFTDAAETIRSRAVAAKTRSPVAQATIS
jgi:Ca2+-binding RTX toxin-like protein